MPRFEAGAARIEGRHGDGWLVAGRLYAPALLVSGTLAGTLLGLSVEALDAALVEGLPLDPADVELLLLGTGATLRLPPPAFVEAARSRGWRVEPMDSPAAARTFNVLVAEERLVAALIL
jgi:uncharacterized protein